MSCHRRPVVFVALGLLLAGPWIAAAPGAQAMPAWPEGAKLPAWNASAPTALPIQPVTKGEAGKWLRWVIPLPKRVRLEGSLPLAASQISFRLRRDATDVEQTAMEELKSLVAEKTGRKDFAGPFAILAGVCDADGKIDGTPIPGAEHLRGLPNSDQAYVIAPLPGRGIAVAALSERGVFHGLKTLSQLLEPQLAKDKIVVPRVAVLDWPDLAERGQWGGSATRDIRYLADRKMNYDFNVTAAAEWSWNARGRDEREMAAAWATRRGLSDPEKAADWAVMLGPVGWDVYGSGIPYPWLFGRAANMIKARNRPQLGGTMFRYFPTAEHIERDLATCDEAMKLAEALGDPAILAETRVIRGYVRMVKSIHAIGTATAGKKKLAEAEIKAVEAAKDELTAAAEEVAKGLEAWRQAVAPDDRATRFADTVEVTRKTAADVAAALVPLGAK